MEWRTENNTSISDSGFSTAHERLILSCFAPGASVLTAEPMQQKQSCPLRVTVRDAEMGDTRQVVLRLSGNAGGVEREAAILPVLLAIGLPVPRLLATPVQDEQGTWASVLEFLPGVTVQAFADASTMNVSTANRLLVEGITRLFALTETPFGSVTGQLPRRTLHDEWRTLSEAETGWSNTGEIGEILARLEASCQKAASETPLVFSSGDYQPGNFLTDGKTVIGYLDFEKAGFEDPLWTLARYPVYDLEPFQSHGFTDGLLTQVEFTQQAFALRVALFGLRTLQTKTDPATGRNAALAERLWRLIHRSSVEARGDVYYVAQNKSFSRTNTDSFPG
ncbi:MAG: phosphotransferase [Armatimonadetes bacterium]|nr:phosphotransferase [Armatimonadota bacterium]